MVWKSKVNPNLRQGKSNQGQVPYQDVQFYLILLYIAK